MKHFLWLAPMLALAGCSSGRIPILGGFSPPKSGAGDVAASSSSPILVWGFFGVAAILVAAAVVSALVFHARRQAITFAVLGIGSLVVGLLTIELLEHLRIPLMIASWSALIAGIAWLGHTMYDYFRSKKIARRLRANGHDCEARIVEAASNGGNVEAVIQART